MTCTVVPNVACTYPEKCRAFGCAEQHRRAFECAEQHKEKQPPRALDVQVGGDHYKRMWIQPIEYCHRNKLGPCETAVVKYISRWREKGGLEDLKKIKHYVDLLIELEGLDKPSPTICPSGYDMPEWMKP